MSGTDKTETVDEAVIQAVAEIDDVDVLKARLIEAETERKQLRSNIGKQNQVHGDRMKAVREENEAAKRRLEEMEARVSQNELAARMMTLTPTQQMQAKNQMLQQDRDRLENEKNQLAQRQRESGEIEKLLKRAEGEGLDPDQIDTSSLRAAVNSYASLKDEYRDREIAELRKIVSGQRDDDIEEAKRAVSGRRVAPTGLPATTNRNTTKVPDEVQKLQDAYNKLKPRRGKAGIGPKMLDLVLRAQTLGYTLD